MLIYNNIIVGAGPIGCHVFNKLKNNSILISGETNKKVNSNKIHPKIKLELRSTTNKFADLLYSKKNKFSIYSSSEVGGLTNYWGKQFFEYKNDEYWPKEIFKNYNIYKRNIDIIDKLYPSTKSKILKKTIKKNLRLNQLSPPIIYSSLINKTKFKKRDQKKIINDRIVSFTKIKKNLIKVITEKNIFYCKKLILCAGPIGNGFILLRSFNQIRYLNFKDDNPRMIFGIKLGTKSNIINNNFKLMDFDIFKNKKLINYSTIYGITPNHFNKFFRPFVIFFEKILQKFFFYGQFWVSGEYNVIKINNYKKKISLSAANINSNKYSINYIKNLNKIGLKILKILNLKYAYGFHYHCLKVNYQGKLFTLNNFINKMKLKNDIYCFDSSIIDKIGLKPPTKTYLATANYLIKTKFNK